MPGTGTGTERIRATPGGPAVGAPAREVALPRASRSGCGRPVAPSPAGRRGDATTTRPAPRRGTGDDGLPTAWPAARQEAQERGSQVGRPAGGRAGQPAPGPAWRAPGPRPVRASPAASRSAAPAARARRTAADRPATHSGDRAHRRSPADRAGRDRHPGPAPAATAGCRRRRPAADGRWPHRPPVAPPVAGGPPCPSGRAARRRSAARPGRPYRDHLARPLGQRGRRRSVGRRAGDRRRPRPASADPPPASTSHRRCPQPLAAWSSCAPGRPETVASATAPRYGRWAPGPAGRAGDGRIPSCGEGSRPAG